MFHVSSMKQKFLQKAFRKIEIYCKFIGMKRILLLTIFVLVICFESFGQDCPIIKVIPPSKLPSENSAMLFSISISGNIDTSKLEYNWSVSQGNIFDGQGTTAITVLRDKKLEGEVIATIEIRGLPVGCKTQFSGETILPPKIICRCAIDEYGKLSWNDELVRLENSIIELIRDSTAKAYIIFSYSNELERAHIFNRQKKILRYLERRKILSERILFKLEKGYGYLTRIRILPEGAELLE